MMNIYAKEISRHAKGVLTDKARKYRTNNSRTARRHTRKHVAPAEDSSMSETKNIIANQSCESVVTTEVNLALFYC